LYLNSEISDVPIPCLLVDPLVLHVPLPTDALPTAAVPLIPVMLVARLCAAPLMRDVALLLPVQSSRESPKSGGVPLSPFAQGTLALPAKSPFSHYPLLGLQTLSISLLSLQTLSFSILGLQTRSPRRAVTTRIRRIWLAAGHLLLLLLRLLNSSQYKKLF